MNGTTQKVEILILGSGPTGLSAAKRCKDVGTTSFLVLEKDGEPGGLANTMVTEEGFLFDCGGHVVFSHYRGFDDMLDEVVKDWCWHERVSYIRIKDDWIPYPFQNNLSAISDSQVKLDCVKGLLKARLSPSNDSSTFKSWIYDNMGDGIAELFMLPYNFKVWATKPSEMQASWLGERVAKPDIVKVVENSLLNKVDAGWGPNSKFRFPLYGGTGAIWKSLAKKVQNHILLNTLVKKVNLQEKWVQVENEDGDKRIYYEKLLNTLPLDIFLEMSGLPVPTLTFCSTHIIGLGIRGTRPDRIDDKCWLYFPEDNCPFYRATVFSNYSPHNCPSSDTLLPTLFYASGLKNDELKSGPYWSLMLEVSESKEKPVPQDLLTYVIKGCIATGLLVETDEIVSTFTLKFDHGYPVPCLARDDSLQVLDELKSLQVWSRGRFGAWKYEVANQDHSWAQGVEAINNMLFGTPEITVFHPDVVNNKRQ